MRVVLPESQDPTVTIVYRERHFHWHHLPQLLDQHEAVHFKIQGEEPGELHLLQVFLLYDSSYVARQSGLQVFKLAQLEQL